MARLIAPLVAAALLGCGGGPQAQPQPAGHYVVQYRAVPVIAPIAAPSECCEVAGRPKLMTRCLVYRGLESYRLGQRARALALLQQGDLLYRSGRRYWLPRVAVYQMQAALYDLTTRRAPIPPRPQPRVGAAVSASSDSLEVETIQ